MKESFRAKHDPSPNRGRKMIIKKKIHENLGLEDGTVRILGIWDTILSDGAAIPPHIHVNVEEIYYILDGRGEINIEGETKEVEAGDVIYIPPGKAHTLIHEGDRPIRFITVSVDVSGSFKRARLGYIA